MDLSILKNKNFSLMLFGETTSNFGDILLNMGLALYVLKLTGSSGQFALILSIGILPKIVLGVVAGAIVDRLDKKKLMIILDGIRGIFLVGLFIFSISHQLTMTYIYVTVILFSVCSIFFSPCSITLLPSILNEEELVAGNALLNMSNETLTVVALMFSAWFYGMVGIGILLLVDGITFLLSAISEMLLDFKSERSSNRNLNLVSDIVDGFRILSKDIRIVSLVINGSLTHMFLFPFLVVGVPHVLINLLKCPDVFYGIIESTSTVALILSSVIVSSMRIKPSHVKGINIGIIGMFVSVLMFSPLMSESFIEMLKSSQLLALGYFSISNFIMYLAFGYYVVFFVSFYQLTVPKAYLGRFGATMSMCFSIGRILGYGMFGYLFELRSFSYAVIILSIGMLLKLIVHLPFIKTERENSYESTTL